MKKNASQGQIINEDGSYVVKKNKKLNIFAFVLCLFAAFFIWIYVMNTQNSNYTKTFSIAIEVINEDDLLEKTGLSVFGVPEKKANVTIQGKKTDVQKYSEKDFRAYIDVSSIDEQGYIPVSIAVETPTTNVSVMVIDPTTVTVYADYLDTVAAWVTPYCDEKGTYVFSADAEQIEISGPRTYLQKIDFAKVIIPYSDEYSIGQTITSSNIAIYDENKVQLSSLYMTFNPDTINVKVESINE